MIRIDVIKNNSNYKKIILKGHANYDEYGKDIVCAAVSSTYLCTINAIISINDKSILISSNNEVSTISVLNNENITKILLDNMLNCLKSLEKQYPNNIKIKIKEE